MIFLKPDQDLGGAAFTSAFGGSATTGAATSAAALASKPAGFSAPVSIKHTTAPTATASPSSAFKVITPASSAGNSKVALSESTSAIA